jgi:hypothetical protein
MGLIFLQTREMLKINFRNNKELIINWTLAIGSMAVFLVAKLSDLSFRFGDGNAYIYMAERLSFKLLPYRDFFLADPPGLLYVLSLFKLFIGQHWLYFQAVPVLFEVSSAFLIFLILKKESVRFIFLGPLFYLTGFSVLATSDFLTGVQVVTFFSLLAVFYSLKNHPIISGFFWAIAVSVKLYAGPLFIAWLIVNYIQNKNFKPIILTVAVSAGIFLLLVFPFLIIDLKSFINDTIIHHLNRPYGAEKTAVFALFFHYAWAMGFLAVCSVFIRKTWKYIFPAVVMFVFFMLFKDLYFLYLNYVFGFLAIGAVFLLERLFFSEDGLPLFIIATVIIGLMSVNSLNSYMKDFKDRGRFLNVEQISTYIKDKYPDQNIRLYGSHEVAPLVALFSEKQLFGGLIDTNAQVFGSDTLDKKLISRDVAQAKTILLTRVTEYPEYKIFEYGYEGFFDKDVFLGQCKKDVFFQSDAKEATNYVGLFFCQ